MCEYFCRCILKKSLLYLSLITCILTFSACASKDTQEVKKDSLVIATSGEPYRFFPQSKGGCGGDDNLVLCNIYDCLLRLENDGTLSPAIAEAYEESEDGMSYIFHLRENVYFQNGYPLTARDVQFTFDYGSKGPLGSALFVNYSSCEIIDDYTVKINLSAPYSAFLYGASSRLGGIVSKQYFDEVGEEGYKKAPVGTGPYMLKEYVSGDYSYLIANENYWKGAPKIKSIKIKIVADPNTQMLGLRNGDYDLVRNPQISTCIKFSSDKTVKFEVTEGTGPLGLYLSEWTGPCHDVNFRKALQYAIDKAAINTFVYENYSETLDVSMCKMYGGYVDSKDGVKTPEYNINMAKAYLEKSDYNGEVFEITVPSESLLEKAGKVIQSELIDIGIDCRLNAVDTITYSEIQNTRNYDSILINNISSLIDADSISTFHRLDRWDKTRCYLRDGELSALLLTGRTKSGDERKQYYIDACNIINDEAYEIPIVSDIVTIAYSDRLEGVSAHCLNYCYFDAIDIK